MRKACLTMALAGLVMMVGGCSNSQNTQAPQIQASCVAPTIVASIVEDSLLIEGQYFLDGCADVIVDGKAIEEEIAMQGIKLELQQGTVTAELATVGASEEGRFATGIELKTLLDGNPELASGRATVTAYPANGYEATAEIDLP